MADLVSKSVASESHAAPVASAPVSHAAPVVDNKAAKEAVAASRKQVADDMKKAREDQIKANNEKMAADAKLRPTPTPEEIMMAMSGHNADQKEPSGAPEQNPNHPIMNAAQQIEVGRKVEPAVSATPKDAPKK
jgi:hypothetical protein